MRNTQVREDILNTDNTVLVVSPLNIIIRKHLVSLSRKGIKSCTLNFSGTCANNYEVNEEDIVISRIIPMKSIRNFNIIYAHPESL